jgi:hypothetical protein
MIKGIVRFPSIIIYSLSLFSFLLEVCALLELPYLLPIKQEIKLNEHMYVYILIFFYVCYITYV